jgi:hypothetical protein
MQANVINALKILSVAGFCAFFAALVWIILQPILLGFRANHSARKPTTDSAPHSNNHETTDRVLTACFAMFLFVAWFFEPAVVYQCGWEGLHECDTVTGQLWLFYAETFDPVFLNLPFWLRLICSLDTFLFGPFYAISLYAFWYGHQDSVWYICIALPYAGALIYSTVVYFSYEVLAEAHRASLFWVFVINLPWTLAPIVLINRLGSRLRGLETRKAKE